MLLLLAVQTGLRVSELISLTLADVALVNGVHVRCLGIAAVTVPHPRQPFGPFCSASLWRGRKSRRASEAEPYLSTTPPPNIGNPTTQPHGGTSLRATHARPLHLT